MKRYALPVPARPAAARMFTILSRIEGLELRIFAEKEAALAWLQQEAES